MGIYRRKDREGRFYGPYIVQYPYKIDPSTGKTRYTTVRVSFSKRLASRVYAQKMLEWEKKKHLGLESKRDYTFRELVDWYMKLPKMQKVNSARHIHRHCRTLKGHFGNMLARDIKPHMIEAYQQERLSEKSNMGKAYRPASINREIEVMKRIFNLALREDMLEKNPCWKVLKLAEENIRDRILSHQEFLALTHALPQHAADIVKMGYFTGMRLGEIGALTWDRVNLIEGYINLGPENTKTREPRRVYLVPQALEVLERARKVRGLAHRYVFTYRGKPIKDIRGALKTALAKTGIKDFRFHDLRHTFNTNMRRAGVERSVIMKLTGHKTLSMFLRYSSVDSEDARDAVAKFRDFLEQESQTTSNSTSTKKKGLSDSA